MSNTAERTLVAADRGHQPVADISQIEVVAPNFKRRLSGITSTLLRILPEQAKAVGIATAGVRFGAAVPHVRWMQLPKLWRAPRGRPFRIWHARRNTEMVVGLVLRDVLRMPVRVVFTSASQRHHTWSSRFLIARMDAVVSTSAKTAGYLKRSSTVVMHGIDATVFSPPPSRAAAKAALGFGAGPLVGCFGRIRRQKGTDVFVAAMIAA